MDADHSGGEEFGEVGSGPGLEGFPGEFGALPVKAGLPPELCPVQYRLVWCFSNEDGYVTGSSQKTNSTMHLLKGINAKTKNKMLV